MASITTGGPASITANLRVMGAPAVISASASVTAQLFAADGLTPVSRGVPLSPNEAGAAWQSGIVVANFLATDTINAVYPLVYVRFVETINTTTRSWKIQVPVDAPVGTPSGSALFPDRLLAIAKMRRDRLAMLAASIMPDLQISDDYIWEKLLAAEAHVAHALRVPLAPTRFFPRQPTAEQIAALPVGMPWDIDPAYDYDPGNYTGDKWGMILARQKPIQSIVGMKFVYPSPQQTIVDVPLDWVRHDGRYGQVQIVPTGTAYQTLLGGFFLSQFSGGRQLPFSIELEYVAGLANVARDYPDLLDAVQKMAVVKVVEDGFMPQSGSISADGLSQSVSVDVSKYHDAVDTILNGGSGSNGGLMARIHGIRMVVI